jgi:ABC-2 type transport system permease protein
MLNLALYKREMKGSWKMLLIFAAVLTLYTTIVISMYDPEMMDMLDEMAASMSGIFAAVGMSAGATTLIGFLSSYLYGFILIMFPMVFTILRANSLIARYVDRGAMVTLVAAPVKRRTVAFTQMKALATGIFALTLYITVIELVNTAQFAGELDMQKLLLLNVGLLALQLFIGGVCFFASCLFNDTKYSVGFGAGVPALMYVLQMLANTGDAAENAKYLTFFTLFNPDGLIAGESSAIAGIAVLFIGAAILFTAAIEVFARKDLHI